MKNSLIFLSCLFLYSTLMAQPGKKGNGFTELEKRVEAKRVKTVKADLKKKLTILKTKTPMFMVDGVEMANLKNVDTAKIDSIHMLLPKDALKAYGAKGKNGALEIAMLKKQPKDNVNFGGEIEVGTKNQEGEIKHIVDTPWPSSPPEASKPNMIPEEKKVYTKTEIEAKYKLNWDELFKKHLRYPTDEADGGIQGKVVINFIVDENGAIYDLKVAPESPVKNPSLVREAIRILLKTNGQWKPAMQNGKEVSAYTQKEILFILPEEK